LICGASDANDLFRPAQGLADQQDLRRPMSIRVARAGSQQTRVRSVASSVVDHLVGHAPRGADQEEFVREGLLPSDDAGIRAARPDSGRCWLDHSSAEAKDRLTQWRTDRRHYLAGSRAFPSAELEQLRTGVEPVGRFAGAGEENPYVGDPPGRVTVTIGLPCRRFRQSTKLVLSAWPR